PNRGDFLVQYEDGYMSISPRKAFLDGYTLADAAPVAGAEASEATVHPSFHPNIVVSARSLVLDRNGRGWWLFPDSMTIIPAEPR
ncbi:hypothetical protein, partial [Pseudomonas lurida]|uniref:hypothetical protein n=1 Tax=Pseudomonas lurida TaxID=244566 RepID=UPI0030D7895B